MKLYLLILILILFPICNAELELTPTRIDTYFLYSGMDENQTAEYRFVSNRDISSCVMIPENENITCIIEEDYIVKLWFSTKGESYNGILKVTDDEGNIKTANVILRVHDFGKSSNIPNIYIDGAANFSTVNLFFDTSDEHIIGIRNWVIIWLFILFLFCIIIAYRSKR